MNRFIPVIVALLALGAPLTASAQYGSYRGAGTVRCESDNNRTQLCRVDTRGGVRLVRQESRAPCIQGRSWGYDRGGIWVTHGCRARFEVGGAYAYAPRNRYDDRYGRYDDRRYDRSYSSGYHGGSGYYGGNGYYGDRYRDDSYRYGNPVAAVLGAILGTGYNRGAPYYNGGAYYGRQPQVFRCESPNGRPRFCRLPFNASRIDLYRQLSRTHCSEGYNWGWRHDGVWVERGCRAEFVVY